MRPDPQNRLDSRAITVWSLTAFLSVAAPLALGTLVCAVLWWLGVFGPIVPAIAALLTATVAVVVVGVAPRVRYARWRYEVNDDEIDLREGVWIVRRTLVPLVRVQHVDTHAGPIMRRFGLAGVKIATAATVHDIPALSVEVADGLRDRIAELARVAEEDV
jgi:membrane protein YdbS with pleckstrin-like domain